MHITQKRHNGVSRILAETDGTQKTLAGIDAYSWEKTIMNDSDGPQTARELCEKVSKN